MAFIDIQDPEKREQIVKDFIKYKRNSTKKKKIKNSVV